MRQAAEAGGSKIELAGLCLGERDEFSHVLGGNVACDHQHFRHGDDQRDRREIFQRFVRHLFHGGVDGERARTDDADGVAVGIGLGDRIGAERAGLSAAVIDHDRLLGQFRHALADDAGDDVVGTAGRKRHDQFYRFFGKILRGGRGRQQQQRQAGHELRQEFSCKPPLTDFSHGAHCSENAARFPRARADSTCKIEEIPREVALAIQQLHRRFMHARIAGGDDAAAVCAGLPSQVVTMPPAPVMIGISAAIS